MASYEGVTKAWADGTYTFRLRVSELRSLQQKFKIGAYVVYKRLLSLDAYLDDAPEVVRLGLIGGGTSPDKAESLVRDYILEPQRFNHAVDLATEIFTASLEGDWGEELPNPPPPQESNENPSGAQMDSSPSEKSTPD